MRAQTLSASNTLYLVEQRGFDNNNVRLITLDGTVINNNLLFTAYDFPANAITLPPFAKQPNTNILLDTGDNRVIDAPWYSGTLWLGFNDGCVPPGGSQTLSCIRLIEMDTNAKTKRQDFDLTAKDGSYYFYPGLSLDTRKNLNLAFGFSSTTNPPGVLASGQIFRSSFNSYDPAIIIKQGTGSDTVNCKGQRDPNNNCINPPAVRYGDYFGSAVDSSNPSIVWTGGQHITNQAYPWATFIKALQRNTIPPTVTSNTPTDGATGVPINGIITATFSEPVLKSTVTTSYI